MRGIVLIAALVAVTAVALVMLATTQVASFARRRANEEQLLFVGEQYRRALRLYQESTPVGQAAYPAALDDLLKDPRYPNVRRYLRALYPDPIGETPDWDLILSPTGRIMGVRSRSTRHPVKTGRFEPPFQAFANAPSYQAWTFCYPDCQIAPDRR